MRLQDTHIVSPTLFPTLFASSTSGGETARTNEQDAAGWREYIYEPGGFTPIALIEQGRVYTYETDQVGCPQELLDAAGTVVWSAEYDAWGGVTRLVEDRVRNPLRLQGQYWDEELGFAYNRYRYSDPGSGGFLRQDPLGLAAGDNLFAIAPSVQGWVDPLGLLEGSASANATKSVNPSSIRFSQNSVNGTADLARSMGAEG